MLEENRGLFVSVPYCEKKKRVLYFPCMGWYEEFRKTIGAAAEQIKGSGHPVHTAASSLNGEVFFTRKALAKMKQSGLSERDALDVYRHGSVVKNNMMVRKYNGYEIGIWFYKDHITGQPGIISIWKRERR
jgi:hypothetical protein